VKNSLTNCLALAEMRVKQRKAQSTDEAQSSKISIKGYVGKQQK